MITTVCMICHRVLGHHNVPESGISHGICAGENDEDSECVTKWLNGDFKEAKNDVHHSVRRSDSIPASA